MLQKIGRRGVVLVGLITVQGVAALFYVADVIRDMGLSDGHSAHTMLELVMTIALSLGVVFMGFQLRELVQDNRDKTRNLRLASGAFGEILAESFDQWGLSPAERDVALLSVKGLSIAEIAGVRETREGTVKAQLNAVYGKAGVSGRPQLLSLFIEGLMGEGLSVGMEAAKAGDAGRAG